MQGPTEFPARVLSIDFVSADVVRLLIAPYAGDGMPYRAGQFLSLQLPDGTVRSYSMAAAHRTGEALELQIQLRDGGRLSNWLRQRDGADEPPLRIRGPFGQCTWQHDTVAPSRVLLLATGTGIAPLNALLEHAVDIGTRSPVTLYWGARAASDLYLRDHFMAMVERLPWFRFVPVVSRADAAWAGRRGHVQDVAASDHPGLRDARVYACGQAAMVAGARALLVERRGLNPDRFHADVFEPAGPDPFTASAGVSAPRDVAVHVATEGQAAQVLTLPVGQSLMTGLQAAGRVRGVCGGRAACGSCRVEVDAAWLARLAPAGRTEARLLAVLNDPRPTHRLACQITLTAELDRLPVALPNPIF